MILTILFGLLMAVEGPGARGVSAAERRMLIQVFEATGGSDWLRHDGWLGPAGTECGWYGVDCNLDDGEFAHVVGLSLEGNGLSGTLPDSLGEFSHLRRLSVTGNSLRPPIPEELLRRWDLGSLNLQAGSLVSPIEEVRLEYSATVLCVSYRAVFHQGGAVSYWQEQCRPTKDGARPVSYCVFKSGRTREFARLARAAFLYVQPLAPEDADMGLEIDAPTSSITVVKGGKESRIESGLTEPALSHWLLEQAIGGMLLRTEWETTKELPSFPRD